MHNKLTMIIQ